MTDRKTQDLVNAIVDRHIAPDGGDDIVDWDVIGNPIRRRDLSKYTVTTAAEPEYEQGDLNLTEDDFVILRKLKREFVDGMIRCGMLYGQCGVISNKLNKLIESL